ncbi:hypothetical protein [Rhodococcus rhodochrous]|uniref:hypothetical protein n=1 Tax=Rhodococcus rhodochrous TaxID=1829 RepID=UPI00177F8FA8|nr:hypothetical protein [Rhodococcus rhodochrous]QOH59851.1 hypothetical protein C6Y44_27550 [Rhodococcus rhodochrous]
MRDDACLDLALDLQDTLLQNKHYDLRIIAEQLILAKGWRKLPRLDEMTELPNVREKWMASLGMALGDLRTLEVGRRGAGELLALFHDEEQTRALLIRDLNSETERANRAEALAEQYRRDSIDYHDNWRSISAENGSLQANLALKQEQVQRQQARADSATAALAEMETHYREEIEVCNHWRHTADRVRELADELLLEFTANIPLSAPDPEWDPNDEFKRCAIDRRDRVKRWRDQLLAALEGASDG